ncbi:aconitate hydratase [Granulicella tundricola]|uniref:Aconitate hydratase A n=1 Tax=Granulicella tundricola (strain ATCC BAA-1859 / DSM 23138 / MP5ACTX9) TaxID=1198114 RepID=E8X3G4_GRATM|nr:aconitate hydratase [Granulicella tundricola]ADW70465.1 aconitate hydratase 1 [Granulicella tundricola MP5ACTX9]
MSLVTPHPNSFGSKTTLTSGSQKVTYFALDALKGFDLAKLPFSLRILLENLLRHEDGRTVTADDIRFLASWNPKAEPSREIAYMPARVLMQDFTGVPAIVDLAAMRDAMRALGGDPEKINPLQPAELVIDHSVQVDEFGTTNAYDMNAALEFQRNRERYAFLKWGQSAFNNFSAVPPGMGICHQVNLEYLARVVFTTQADAAGEILAYPDTLVGTDSHTTMVNGLGVLGWGVGGIEAEAAMLGQPVSMLVPQVVGFKLTGKLKEGTTATDLVLTVTEALRKLGVVGKFVEFYGPGISELPLADRATIANMAPEYGATCGIFPVDHETLAYLRLTGRTDDQIKLVEEYMRAQGLFHTPDAPEAEYSATMSLDLSTVEPSVAGPKRPQDRVLLSNAPASFAQQLPNLLGPVGNKGAVRQMVRWEGEGGHMSESGDVTSSVGAPSPGTDTHLPIADGLVPVSTLTAGPHAVHIDAPVTSVKGRYGVDVDQYLDHGSIVIAAITSCTNTSNPYVMMAAGLLAKKAVEKGLRTPPWVKTSLAPGSRVVTDYYVKAGLMQYLDALRFQVVGYGCTTCIGNSGPLPTDVSKSIEEHGLVAVSVLSGNRNFEGRISPEVRANYLMSPPLVVAYALAGTIHHDFEKEPIGYDPARQPVFLKDIWPTQQEVIDTVNSSINSEMFRKQYSTVSDGDQNWQNLSFPSGDTYGWEPDSTYIRKAPYFDGMPATPVDVEDIRAARCLAVLGDSVTTDHISPAGSIKKNGPAGKYLMEHGVEAADFNSYGSRRGNHEVMVRGTFANVRLRNKMAPGTEGGVTRLLPEMTEMSIYDASVEYARRGTPLAILAGKEYGSGSSRDWAAKGPRLLGIRFVIAESYERIHRSNLVGMGILPLQFEHGESAESLGLTGEEIFEITGLKEMLDSKFAAGKNITVKAENQTGTTMEFPVTVRIDTPQEILYYQHGGILQYVLRQLAGKA